MEKNVEWKKMTKLIALLISSLLISTASASIINQLTITATVGVQSPDVVFWQGSDWDSAGGSMGDANQSVTFSSLNGKNGSLTTYSEPVLIKNKSPTASYYLNLTLSTYSGLNTHLKYINITMYEGTTKKGNSIILLASGPQSQASGSVLMGTSASWRVQWDIYWFGNATTSDSVQITLKLQVWPAS